MTDLTDFERKTLEILQKKGPISYTSGVGFLLLEATAGMEGSYRKQNPSPQGVALFAGRFLGKLRRRGLVGEYKGWHITDAGRKVLSQLSEES